MQLNNSILDSYANMEINHGLNVFPFSLPASEDLSLNLTSRLEPEAKVLAIIPARGGSKGLPRKNVLPLCGKPLISYSIEAALKSSLINKIIVSSDDDEILGIAREYSLDMALKRPAEYADDTAKLNIAVDHALASLKSQGYEPDFVAMLYPTSPFRTPELIDHLVGKGMEGFSPVLTVRPVDLRRRRFVKPGGPQSGQLVSDVPLNTNLYRFYGLFSGCRTDFALKPYVYPVSNEIQLLDIDYRAQFDLAEQIIANRLFDFGQD